MSSTFTSADIQEDIALKKAKLEALKAKRLARQQQQQQHDETKLDISSTGDVHNDTASTMNGGDIYDPSLPASSTNSSFLDESLIGGMTSLETSTLSALDESSTNVNRLNDSLASVNEDENDNSANGDGGASVSTTIPANSTTSATIANSPPSSSPSSSSAPAHPPSFNKRRSTRLSNMEQLVAIRNSFDEITQHSATVPTLNRRASLIPAPSGAFQPSPPPPASSFVQSPPSHSAGTVSLVAEENESSSRDTDTDENESDTSALTHTDQSQQPPSSSLSSPLPPSIITPADPAAQSRMIEELIAEIDELNESIRSKNADLAMAGDLGSVLLQTNEEANKRIDDLQSLVDQQSSELYALKEELQNCKLKNKKLQTHLTDQHHLHDELESENEILRMELELDRQKLRTAEMNLLNAHNHTGVDDQLRQLTQQLNEAHAQSAKLESTLHELARRKEELELQVKSLQSDHADLKNDLIAAEKYEPLARELQDQLTALKAHDTVNVLAELQWENQRLNETLQEYQQQYEILHETNIRDQELLRNLQLMNEALQRELSDSKLSTNKATRFNSLADDAELDDGTSKDSSSSTSTSTVSETEEEKKIRLATAAAAMHLGSLHVKKVPRSSLASGSASLAYTPEKGGADVNGDTPIKPITAHSTPLQPPLNSSLTLSGHGPIYSPGHSSSKSQNGMMGFLSSIIPGSNTNSPSSFSGKRLSFTPTTSHPLTITAGHKRRESTLIKPLNTSESVKQTPTSGTPERNADWSE